MTIKGFKEAAEEGDLATIMALVGQASDEEQADALGRAAGNGHVDVVMYLIGECGVGVDAKTKYGYTALMRAAFGGHMSVVQYLVEPCGANVDAMDDDGSTVLMEAARNGRINIVRYLAEQCHADVNAKDNGGFSALVLAARYGHIEVVRYLAEQCDANVYAKCSYGSTALMWAAEDGYIEVVRYLAEKWRADVNAKNNGEDTALMWSARHGHIDVVRYLVQRYDADLNARDDEGSTALMKASRYDHVDVVRYLAERRDVDVNATDKKGYTALMWAVEQGHMMVVQCLVEQYNADVNATSTNGTTAHRLATGRGYQDIQRILMPFIRSEIQSRTADETTNTPTVVHVPPNCSIDPSEIQLTLYSQNGNIGGDFQAKWLDADAVVKLFIPDASRTPFEDEVHTWQQLRHPNVLKLYGACVVISQLQFFVCEYASQGSLLEHVKSSAEGERPTIWKYLYEAALGLEYLHERGIVHGDLRCSNILIGSDGMAKLSNFGLSGSVQTSTAVSDRVARSMRWQAPEVLEGKSPSFQSDVYSLGMSILEAATKEIPWSEKNESWVEVWGKVWTPEESGTDLRGPPKCTDEDARDLVWKMCCRNPHKRAGLSSVVCKLEHLATMECSDYSQPEQEPVCTFEEFEYGRVQKAWKCLEARMEKCTNTQYCRIFDQVKLLHERLRVSTHPPALLTRFHALVTEFYQTVKMSPDQALMMRLSSTRATSNSLHAFQWRIESLMSSLGGVTKEEGRPGWQQQRPDEAKPFVSGVSDTFLLLLQKFKTTEERAAYLKTLKAEIENPLEKYTPEELKVMKKACAYIISKLETENWSKLIPEWFIPWYELIVDEGTCLGAGGFGSVNRAKWLDSEVVVKRVILPGPSGKADISTSWSSLSASDDPYASEADTDPDQRRNALEMFRREVDIWFGFSHPHVIRLFGACHVGRPFFVCEYATNGTLVSYLRDHPDELWSKLHGAALGVQYLHARDVVHGDLKGNNIVIGSDFKAKVTDFGLSSASSSEDTAQISGAWHWVAPECFPGGKAGEAQQLAGPTFPSDVYSLGMCIVEALRVVEAVKVGKDFCSCLPWRVDDRNAVRYHATHGTLPGWPVCSDSQWNLVQRMCALEPQKRLRISTVVDELARLANPGSEAMTTADISSSNATNRPTAPNMIAAARQVLAEQANRVLESPKTNGVKYNGSRRWSTGWRARVSAAKRLSCSTLPKSGKNHISTSGDHDRVYSLYASLWERFQWVYEQIAGNASEDCQASFYLFTSC